MAGNRTCLCNRPPQSPTDSADGTFFGTCPACSDGIDNDGDGRTDFPFDADCFDSMDDDEAPTTPCFNGIDDDGDGLVDWPDDPGCVSAYDADESNGASTQCSDGIDNDGDGRTDYPQDPGCYAAVDNTEDETLTNPIAQCSDGIDNDGDGFMDFPADLGCSDANDLDEAGPAVCFFCERFTHNKPGQCDIGEGYCKARSGVPLGEVCSAAPGCPGACESQGDPARRRCLLPCTDSDDCRGGVCDTTTGRCRPCLSNDECPEGVCDAIRGWCLSTALAPTTCSSTADCASCDTQLGFCGFDPFYACADDKDCRPDQVCSPERGFCLQRVFDSIQCIEDADCPAGVCDTTLGRCLPGQASEQCNHDDECPFGDCLSDPAIGAGLPYCDQQSFVLPADFRPEADCVRAR
ncbi:MAG: hypothetical protein R3C68_10960 [Myxococcota bacterium]